MDSCGATTTVSVQWGGSKGAHNNWQRAQTEDCSDMNLFMSTWKGTASGARQRWRMLGRVPCLLPLECPGAAYIRPFTPAAAPPSRHKFYSHQPHQTSTETAPQTESNELKGLISDQINIAEKTRFFRGFFILQETGMWASPKLCWFCTKPASLNLNVLFNFPHTSGAKGDLIDMNKWQTVQIVNKLLLLPIGSPSQRIGFLNLLCTNMTSNRNIAAIVF